MRFLLKILFQRLFGHENLSLILLLVFSFSIRLLLFSLPGYKVDINSFFFWYNHASSGNFFNFYEPPNWTDYPPFNVYIFWLFGNLFLKPGLLLQSLFPGLSLSPGLIANLAVKLAPNIFDLAVTSLIYLFLRRHFSFRASLLASAAYSLNPAVLYDLAVWGQMDSIYSFFMIASLLFLLGRKYEFSAVALSLGFLTKPQSLILLPLLIYMLARERRWWRYLSCALISFSTIFLVTLPFSEGNPISFLMKTYQKAYDIYPFTSINAYNFWGILGKFWKPDSQEFLTISLRSWGLILFLLFVLAIIWRLHKRFSDGALIFSAFLLSYGFFFFMTRMHERYIFSALPILSLSLPRQGSSRWIYAGLSLTFLASLAYILPVLNSDGFVPEGHISFAILVPSYFLLLAGAFWSFLRDERGPPVKPEPFTIGAKLKAAVKGEMLLEPAFSKDTQEIKGESREATQERPGPSIKTHWPIAFLCFIFLVLSLWNLGSLKLPKTNWRSAEAGADFYLEFQGEAHVDSMFIFAQENAPVNLEIYSGRPEAWVKSAELKTLTPWKQWQRLSFNLKTQYLRLVFIGATPEIGEITVFSNNKPVKIAGLIPINRDRDRDREGLGALIDEPLQSLPSFKEQSYFDEVYFARTAEEYLKGRVPFEWSHPPLGKLIIGTGTFLLGSSPFAWRITGVIAAMLALVLIYLIGVRIFGSPRAGMIAAFLLAFDFMHYTESRLATAETFIFLFIVALFLFFLRYYKEPEGNAFFLFLSFVVFGLGLATKWVTMNSLVGLLILVFLLRGIKVFNSRELMALLLGGAAAGLLYFLSYIPDILVGRSLKELWSLQMSMLGYHSGLRESHPFGSPWWGWPLMFRPVWLYSGELNGLRSEIVLFGNPALWWGSIPAIALTGYLAFKKQDKYALFILIPYLTQWLLFGPVSRVLFIYHFYPNVLFMVLAATFWIERLWPKHRGWCLAYLVLNLALFMAFFPVISGLPMPESYWESLKGLILFPRP